MISQKICKAVQAGLGSFEPTWLMVSTLACPRKGLPMPVMAAAASSAVSSSQQYLQVTPQVCTPR